MPNPSATRQIRVFVSSTFTDMKEDRDYLVKFIFPQLRKLCEERAVVWTEIDLRWGVTDEQKAEGKVLPIVMAEIERCHPYFVGLLGERYGQAYRDKIPADLLELYPWLNFHGGKSLTELEILHGVLNSKELCDRALFYFRRPAYAREKGARADFVSTDEENRRKLEDLKQRIRDAHTGQKLKFAPREDYASPQALGDQLLADFRGIIESLYPETETPGLFDQESARHEAYAQSRRLAFVGRADLLRKLDGHVSGDAPITLLSNPPESAGGGEAGRGNTASKPLILTGESGCGKSALLAEWVSLWRKGHPDDIVIQHFTGSTPRSANCEGLIYRVLAELKIAFAISDEIPTDPNALRSGLAAWFRKVAGSRRIVLVLDALNQLIDDNAARQLGWLPQDFPPNFRLLVSTLPGECLDTLRKRGWPELCVPLFGRDEIAPAATAYFRNFSKTPSLELLSKLESAPAACNALYLRTVLDELRQFGEHEELNARAAYYLHAQDLPELFGRVLTRWHDDFDNDPEHPDLVRRSLCFIACARDGLSETELLDLLGEDCEPMPRRMFTPFYLAAENALVLRAGLLNFGHSYLRAAIQERWLGNNEFVNQCYHQLATYFANIKEATRRKLSELPSLLIHLQEWEKLRDLLAEIPVAIALRASARWEHQKYWQLLRDRSDPAEVYSEAMDKFVSLQGRSRGAADAYTSLAHFFHNWGHISLREKFHRAAFELRTEILGKYHPDTCSSATFLAQALEIKGELVEAEKLYRQALDGRVRELGDDHVDTLKSLNNMAILMSKMGRRAEADKITSDVFERSVRLLGPDHQLTLVAERNLAYVVDRKGDPDAAEVLYRRAAEGMERCGYDLAESLSFEEELAMHLRKVGKWAEAESRFNSILAAREKLAGPDHPSTCRTLHNLIVLYAKTGRKERARAMCATSWQRNKANVIASKPYAITAANELGDILLFLEEFSFAAEVYGKSYEACKEAYGPAHEQTLVVAINLALAFTKTGQFTKAEALYADALDESRNANLADPSIAEDLSRGLSILHQQHPLLALKHAIRQFRRLFSNS
jgi:nephrocystin-3